MRKLEYRLSGGRSRRTRSHAVAQAGSVSLEFVLLFPFLIMVLVGIIDFSLMMYDKAALASGARSLARAATVLNSNTQAATNNLNASVIGFGTAVPHVSGPSPTCTSTTSGTSTTVTVSYTYQGLLLGSAFSALTGPVSLQASAVMNCE